MKVLKLESSTGGEQGGGSNLSMNQTLDGHNGGVMCVTWNANYSKLTTSDQKGLIIVWMLHKGAWFEEMINNRNKSVVQDMKWTSDGQKICIVYADGAVIVGSVDGNRLWGKELDIGLHHVEWSPEGKNILFFLLLPGTVHVYDSSGNRVKALPLPAKAMAQEALVTASASVSFNQSRPWSDSGKEDDDALVSIAGLDWYDGAEGFLHQDVPTLCVAMSTGHVQIMKGIDDCNPVLLDAKLSQLWLCQWNTNGTVLALSGCIKATVKGGETRNISVVKFFSPYGEPLRVLKVPGHSISSLSWEGGGLRLALAVDSYIYFANIRPDYNWGYAPEADTLVYAYQKPERAETCVCYWDLHSNRRQIKFMHNLKALAAAGENVLTVIGPEAKGTHLLTLSNCIGNPMEMKRVQVEPVFVAMAAKHVVVANKSVAYVWQYKTSSASQVTSMDAATAIAAALKRSSGRESIVDPHSHNGNTCISPESYRASLEPPDNPISAVAIGETALILALEDGMVMKYSLPHIGLDNCYSCRPRPNILALNMNCSLLSVIDHSGILTVLDLDMKASGNTSAGKPSDEETGASAWSSFERKDAWSLQWSEDRADSFAVMEKTRMIVFNGQDSEEPTTCSGYLCSFKDLTVKAVLLDDIMAVPEAPETSLVVDLETGLLKELVDVIGTQGLEEAYELVQGHDGKCTKLWRILADSALEALDFGMADKAFVKCSDYASIQFVKRIQGLPDRIKQRAEVSAYFERHDEAEVLYREIDRRRDLAIKLRQQLGNWFRVVQLVKQGGGDDEQLTAAWDQIGQHYTERGKWAKAVQYFKQAKNSRMVAECHYRLEDYGSMEDITKELPNLDPLLLEIGSRFQGVGQVDAAVDAFLKGGDVKAAIDACVVCNAWGRAVALAEEHGFPQIEGLLAKYAMQLLANGDRLQAVELYRKANKATDAALLLAKLAEEAGKKQVNPLRAKKLHVLAALEVERHRKKVLEMTSSMTRRGHTAADVATATAATLDTLMATRDTPEDKNASKARMQESI
ncbi:unnamed protein product [Chrysoparadoxa australica]